MITCTLGEKKYTVDFVSGRALREMEPASKMYGRLVRLSQDATEGKDVSQEQLTVTDALDTMVKWFCILFNNQFTPDEMYDNYPADRLMHNMLDGFRQLRDIPALSIFSNLRGALQVVKIGIFI
jgi:hypothetical protein